MFEFLNPTFIIRDPEIIKRLVVKEFDSFSEHREMFPVETEPMIGKVLFFMKGQEWKGMKFYSQENGRDH